MNESELEKELRALRPTEASLDLRKRIETDLAGTGAEMVRPSAADVASSFAAGRLERRPAVVFGWWRNLGWASAGAAAALLVSAFFRTPTSSAEVDAPTDAATAAVQFQPAGSSREVLDAQDDGLLYDEDQTPQRRLRFQSLERHRWTNSATGAVLHFEVPREDTVLVPVAMQ